MTTTRAASEQITDEVTSWPGVEAGIGSRGEFGFTVGRRQIGHLHGDHAAHFSFPKQVFAELFAQGRVVHHPVFPGKPGPGGAPDRWRGGRARGDRAAAAQLRPGGCAVRLAGLRCQTERSMSSENSFDARAELEVGGRTYEIYRLDALQSAYDVARLPFSLKVLLENLLRNEDGVGIRREDIEALATWDANAEPSKEIAFTPARVILQDFTGVPCVVDLAALRDAMAEMGGDPSAINPLVPVELVIDHSVQVDAFGSAQAFRINAEKEYERNGERYAFLRWGQTAFEGFKAVPPDTGIVHQVNLEYLARVVFENDGMLYPDTLVGTDSHTTMINGLGVLGWGVGGIEAEAAMLGQPMPMLIPRVLGFKLSGELREGATATDLVLTVTQRHARARRRGPVRRVLRPGHREPAAGGPRDARQHVAGVRLDVRDLPDRRRDAALPGVLRPHARARRARRDLRQGAGAVARRALGGGDVLRDARARPRRRRAVAGGPQAPAGPRLADGGEGVVPDGAGRLPARAGRVRRAARGDVPRERPDGPALRQARAARGAGGRRDRRRAGRGARERQQCR